MKLLRELAYTPISFARGLVVTFVNFFRPAVTLQYPDERWELPTRYRGLHGLVIDPETGDERCIGCEACSRICPDGLIDMKTVKKEGHKGKFAEEFTVDISACMFCGLCAEACPTQALLLFREYEFASHEKGTFLIGKDQLLAVGAKWLEGYPSPIRKSEVKA